MSGFYPGGGEMGACFECRLENRLSWGFRGCPQSLQANIWLVSEIGPRRLPHYRTIIRGVFKTKLIKFPKCILFYSSVYVWFTESVENIKFVCVFMLLCRYTNLQECLCHISLKKNLTCLVAFLKLFINKEPKPKTRKFWVTCRLFSLMIGFIKCEGGTKSSDLIILRTVIKRSPFYIFGGGGCDNSTNPSFHMK
jgi:hypothetical protein